MLKKRLIALALAAVMVGSMPILTAPVNTLESLDTQLDLTSQYVLKTDPTDTLGNEWRLLGLLRGGFEVPAAQREHYYWAAMEAFQADYPSAADSARMALALTALGYDLGSPYDMGSPAERLTGSFMRSASVSEAAWVIVAANRGGIDMEDSGMLATLLKFQQPGGGFSLDESGRSMAADPDLTAMMLQALACFDQPEAREAGDAALAYLSQVQQPGGGYMSMGAATAESAAQVILALTTLGVELDDPRFIKGGNSVLDALLAYALPDGSFCHIQGGAANAMATEQALLALVALRRQRDGLSSVWDMSDVPAAQAPSRPESLPGRHPDISAPAVSVPDAGFSDLEGCPQAEAVVALARLGVVEGMGDGRFDPSGGLTRAQFAALLVRALGLPQRESEAVFADVPATAWHAEYIATAVHYGLIAGRGSGRFDPEGAVTLQEAAVMVSRAAALGGLEAQVTAAGLLATDILAQFDDYRQAADWADAGLAFCVDSGILAVDGMALEPARAMTRGETAALLHSLLARLELLPA